MCLRLWIVGSLNLFTPEQEPQPILLHVTRLIWNQIDTFFINTIVCVIS